MKRKRNKTGVGYYFSRVFPPISEMRDRYPELKKRGWLLPVCWVKRFFTLFNPNIKERALLELKAEKKSNEQEGKRVEALLKELDIL